MAKKESQQSLRELTRIKRGEQVNLAKFDCGETFGRQKVDADKVLAANLARLTDLQIRIYAEAKHAVLIVLQGIDAAGKDGTIRVIAGAFNPQCTPVTSFKSTTWSRSGSGGATTPKSAIGSSCSPRKA